MAPPLGGKTGQNGHRQAAQNRAAMDEKKSRRHG